MKTLDTSLFASAHAAVQGLIDTEKVLGEDRKREKYRTAVKGAPAFIQGCGLAQALAFWRSKASAGTDDAFGYNWLLKHLGTFPGLENLEKRAREAEIEEYMFLTRRTQAALVFLKRMTDAFLPRTVGGEE